MSFEGDKFNSQAFLSCEHHIFIDCSFHYCNFTDCILRNARFSSCLFHNCNLSLTKIEGCRFQNIEFIDCKIVGLEFFKCDKIFFSPSFKSSWLHYCNFSDLNLKNFPFFRCKLIECYFTNNNLIEANFQSCDLLGTIFHNCDLSKADFSKAINYTIDPQSNKIKKAIFSIPEVLGLLKAFDIIII